MSDGTHTAEQVTLARLPSGVELTTTVHTYRGGDSGPTLYVQAAQHGREINGTAVLRRFHDRLPLESLSGTVVAVPVANPLTFDRVSYTAPDSIDSVNDNMNRVWPGDESGSLHQRMAARLWEHIEDADAVVDLHTGSPDMLPHVVYLEADEPSAELARAFGTDLLLAEEAAEDAPDEWHRRGFAGKLRVAATQEGIPSITPELAHSKQILESVVEDGVVGLTSVLAHLEMLPREFARERDQNRVDAPIVARNHLGQVTAEESGLFRPNPDLELGQSISTGVDLGTIYQPATYEVLERPVTDREGILYTLTREATVTAGSKLASVAIREEDHALE
ncbi:succinylglutamate desuccinylase [Halostagnicola sp. A56]|uniref:succinylglutamate desuccinylase/aspartoacylase family protein n=1 Tax=Halostagnicola sp. A56 TaxID=1495067 RepID=UPI0004A16C91|nr:succinylglutamate desuccinylase/aspartoacylase family protein [Halostagnicola sp. A56]KDE59615.1 succinylglutamate desuccinylase [Halostagnicola sp. A56]